MRNASRINALALAGALAAGGLLTLSDAKAARQEVPAEARATTEGYFTLRIASNAAQVSIFFLQFDQAAIKAQDGKGKTCEHAPQLDADRRANCLIPCATTRQ